MFKFREPAIKHIEPIIKKNPKEPEWRTLHGVADGIRPKLIRAFLNAVEVTAGAAVLRRVEEAIAVGNIAKAEESIPWEQLAVELGVASSVLRTAFERAAEASMKYMPQKVQASLRFDLLNPRAVEWIREHTGELIRDVTEGSRIAIRGAIERAYRGGMHPYKAARHIQGMVGLTERQAVAVDNYYNRLIKQGMSEGKALSSAREYTRRLLKDRAENIARTETVRAANMGQQELWRQAADQGLVDINTVKRIWIVTPDDRLCSYCAPMDGQEVGLEENFQSGTVQLDTGGIRSLGSTLTPPLHPRCRCAMELRP